jgi:hypothetical protein
MNDEMRYPGDDLHVTPVRLATYAALLAAKVIVVSSSTRYFAVDQQFFFSCLAEKLCHIFLDPDWYLTQYPDVREAISKGQVSDARNHYVRFGFYEHRLPYKINVDEAWYLESYPDVGRALQARLFVSGQAHFENDGFREGRFPYPNFTLRQNE